MSLRTEDRANALPLAVPGGSIIRQVGWLALPVLIEQALLYLVGFSDTVLTGRYLAVEHLAAVTVSSYLFWTLGSLMMIVSAGGTALVARLVGGGDREGASRICCQAIGLALFVGAGLLVLGFTSAPTLLQGLGLRGEAAIVGIDYLRIVLLAAPLLACETVGVACLRGTGDTRTGMWVMVLVNSINVALSWLFVVGPGSIPSLGLSGIALGTAVGEGVGGLVILVLLARGRSGLRLTRARMIPDLRVIRRILRISLPAAGESTVNSLCQLWFLSLITRLGATATAAHGVAIRCEAIAFLTVTAFAVAAGTLTGQYLGAARPDLASRSARTAWGLGVGILCVLGTILYAGAEPLFNLFLGGGQAPVLAQGVPVLRLVAFALPALATINVLNGSLRGAGDTRWPLVIVLVGYLGVRIPLAYALTMPEAMGGFGWGLYGAWVAMFADLSVRAILVAARFLQGGWRSVRV